MPNKVEAYTDSVNNIQDQFIVPFLLWDIENTKTSICWHSYSKSFLWNFGLFKHKEVTGRGSWK